MTDPSTAAGCLQAAWAALSRGDEAERDRLCQRAKLLVAAENRAAAIERVMTVDFYVTAAGVAIKTTTMARAAGDLH